MQKDERNKKVNEEKNFLRSAFEANNYQKTFINEFRKKLNNNNPINGRTTQGQYCSKRNQKIKLQIKKFHVNVTKFTLVKVPDLLTYKLTNIKTI